ncbi:MAG: nickel-dependent hydrogenase large subunit [Thermodesulfobacteriota bacterium]
MSTQRKHIQIYPLNRVEGDLKVRLEIQDGVVTDAWSAGTMYRGFENILRGRGALDGLVITPRICGVCSTAHLKAAAKALDMITGVKVPGGARRIRNGTLMVEMLQNDIRHGCLLFMSDFARPIYRNHSLYDEAVRRYPFLTGSVTRQVIHHTKKILEIVAILGGQWPHSSFMVPGGVVSLPSRNEIMQCRYLLSSFRSWYETEFLGCRLERWQEIAGRADLDAWLDENPDHREKEIGFFIRFAREAGLEQIGRGHGNFLCYGLLDMPQNTAVKPPNGGPNLLPAGFAGNDGKVEPFRPENVAEDITHSWFSGYSGARQPMEGLTRPYATGSESEKYSWAKAPRYDGKPAETGPLAEMIIAGNPLFTDLVNNGGPTAFSRQLARLVRPALIMPVLEQWLKEISLQEKRYFQSYDRIETGEGFGLIEAPRGALGHWVKIRDGKIAAYQIITPSAWNASPRDSGGIRGPWEQALIGAPIKNPEEPIEADHILRSFDPCLVCTVHAVRLEKQRKCPKRSITG